MRNFIMVSNLAPEINLQQETIVLPVTGNGTFPLILVSKIRGRLLSASYRTNTGSCNLTFKVGTTNIPGMASLSCSTSVNTAESDDTNDTNVVDISESLNLTIASAVSLQWVYVTLCLRQLASEGGWTQIAKTRASQGCEYTSLGDVVSELVTDPYDPYE